MGLIASYVYFAWVHAQSFLRGSRSNLLFLLVETTILLLFVARQRASSVSGEPMDVLLAFGGTFGGVLFRPVSTPGSAGTAIVMLGAALQFGALLSLNRSFGILPAIRGVKTTGLYGAVRHPLYAAYLVAWVGYLINNPSVRNAFILALVTVLLSLRAMREERFLLGEPCYQDYASRVRWRLLPGVF
jgi:protein-S-isoprenylcysteine O-methyltransferase Ste14